MASDPQDVELMLAQIRTDAAGYRDATRMPPVGAEPIPDATLYASHADAQDMHAALVAVAKWAKTHASRSCGESVLGVIRDELTRER